MGHLDKSLCEFQIRPRRLPSSLLAIVVLIPLAFALILRRDVVVVTGVSLWLLATMVLAALSVWLVARALRPQPLIHVDLSGVSFPKLFAGPLSWTDIRNIDVETMHGRLGDAHDKLIFHFNTPMPITWLERDRQRILGKTPQAAFNVTIGAAWPMRAEDIRRRIIETAAVISENKSSEIVPTDALPDRRRRAIIIAALLLSVLTPVIFKIADIGLPRQFSTGLSFYDAGDILAALPYLEADGRSGDAESAYILGEIYLNGDGVERNLALATAWFKRAAEAGSMDGAFRLGEAYRLGLGTPVSIAQATRWLTKAADRGMPEAAYSLSRLYRRGDGVRRDYPTALKWLYQAAQAGFAAAEHDLGRLYFEGLGVDVDKGEAIKWYASAAGKDFLPARFDLAKVLLDGDIGDRRAGIDHLIAAANGGYPPAQRRLARHYVAGNDLQQDPVAAYKWISLATRAWPKETRSDVVREKVQIGSYLSDQQRQQAMDRIRAWRPTKR